MDKTHSEPVLNRTPLYKQVSTHIQKWIFTDGMNPGERLPSERKLCSRYDVSRTVIREALKDLSARGFVEIEAGKGVFVKKLTIEDVSKSISQFLHVSENELSDLLDVREMLECKISELAAKRATSEDLFEMRAALKEMDTAADDVHRYLKGDLAFHSALAKATKSDVFPGLINSLISFLFDIRLRGFLVGGAKQGRKDHKMIYEAVKKNDPVLAQNAMKAHLLHVRDDVQKVNLSDDRSLIG